MRLPPSLNSRGAQVQVYSCMCCAVGLPFRNLFGVGRALPLGTDSIKEERRVCSHALFMARRRAVTLASCLFSVLLAPSAGWRPFAPSKLLPAASPRSRAHAPLLCAGAPEGNEGLFAAVRGDAAAGAIDLDLLRTTLAENEVLRLRVGELEEAVGRTEGLCEVLDDGGGWTSSVRSRASWLLGLLICQSFSSFILADNEQLLVSHPTIIYFMTMLVGAGGNAGNQVSRMSQNEHCPRR